MFLSPEPHLVLHDNVNLGSALGATVPTVGPEGLMRLSV